ncbi:cytochrome P450 [Sphingoaurantiacus capsulatus]|uniref:Cytochrome P450 n=1 Tax=Sphingoaurantiacus capsulatus TaxID=1771310 RepID=A0ABV7X9Q3_9SPHN
MAHLDLLDTANFADGHPHAAYDALRADRPVYRHPGSDKQPPFWMLTRYDDIRAVSLDAKNFTSTKGFRVPTDKRAAMDPEIGRTLARFMLAMDNPEHAAFRNLVASAFMPAAIARFEPRVEASVAKLMADIAGRDEVEFVEEVGAIVPIRSICTIMGVPPEDEWRVFEFTNAVFGTDDPDYAASVEVASERYLAIFDYALDLIERRHREPRDDLISLIAHAEIDGRPLDDTEKKSFFSNMIAAGNETTRSSLAGALWALWRFPDQRRRLVDDPSLIPAAINELLRWHSPVFQMARTATQDVVIGGETIAAGERVAMLYGAGNHDPAVFDDPHTLDITRANAKAHLAFGYGIHHCAGLRLATLQLKHILTAFLTAYPDYEVIEPPRFIRSNFVGAMKSLRLRLR